MQNLENNDFIHSETLSAFLSREKLQKIDGKYKPNHNQLKSLVCYDEVNLGEIDTSEITSFRELFKNSTRRDFSGIDSWDTSKVTTFMSCFENAVYFNENINAWNVSNGTNFMQMFYNAKSFNQPLDGWKMSSATNTIRMFFQAKEFNQNIESWDMSNVVWAWEMFRGAENFNSPLNKWNVSSVTKMQGMFLYAKSFNQSLDKWNVGNVVDMQGIFSGAQSFNQNLSAWGDKLGKVRNAKRAFADTKSLTKDFLKDWKFSSFCDKENIIKGSALEAKTTSTATKSKNLYNFAISQINKKEIPNKIRTFESNTFKESYIKWLPKNIKDETKIYLAKCDENDNLISGDEKSWDFAYYEIFNRYFMIEKYESSNQSNEIQLENPAFYIIQKRKISDLQKDENFRADEVKDIYESSDLSIKIDSQNMWIANSDLTDNSEAILGLLNIFILAQSYIIQMQTLEEIARDNSDNSKELQKCYKKICEFDLRHYRNQPILQNTFLQHIWQKISAVYMVAQTHDELKEVITQMAGLVNERKQTLFNWLMFAVAVFSALGAILAAIPVVEKWVN